MFQRFDSFRIGLALLNKIYFWSDSFSLHIFFPPVLYEGVPDTCSVLFLWQLKVKDFFIVCVDIPMTHDIARSIQNANQSELYIPSMMTTEASVTTKQECCVGEET